MLGGSLHPVWKNQRLWPDYMKRAVCSECALFTSSLLENNHGQSIKLVCYAMLLVLPAKFALLPEPTKIGFTGQDARLPIQGSLV